MSALNTQIAGNHYKQFKIQPIEFITKNNIGFIEGNVIKYICRYKHKNGLQDLKKIKHYIDLLIELEYPQEEPKETALVIPEPGETDAINDPSKLSLTVGEQTQTNALLTLCSLSVGGKTNV